MSGFTQEQRELLDDFLKGAGARQHQQSRKHARGAALLAAVRQTAMAAAPSHGKVSLTKLEKAVDRYYQELSPECRSLLADELDRRGFREKESGVSTLLYYCIAELKRSGHEISQVSETVLAMVRDILDEGGVKGNGSVYELVVGKFDAGSWQHNGLLKLLGYKVGNAGQDLKHRRTVLRDAYRALLVPGSQDIAEYLRSWGSPLSDQRLDKITGSITRFMALARNQKADFSAALADWQADLDWLRRSGGTR